MIEQLVCVGISAHANEEVPAIALNMAAMPSWRGVTWPQRGLLIGIIATVLVFAMRPTPTGLATSTTSSHLLWAAFVLNSLLLVVLGSTAIVTTQWGFRQGFPSAQLRRQRRAVRRRAVLLGVIAYVAHQTMVVLLDPRFSLERLTGRRRVFGPVVTVPDRLELAWAFTAVALGYIILAWLLWRSAGTPHVGPSDASVPPATAVFESRFPLAVATPTVEVREVLPRDPVTGRVIRQFDIQS